MNIPSGLILGSESLVIRFAVNHLKRSLTEPRVALRWVAYRAHSWRNIALALIDLQKGETKAHTGANACLRQLTTGL
jgi:hypothetical protein